MNADKTQVLSLSSPETRSVTTRRRVLARLREYFDNGFRDPELLYLGARYAVSLRMEGEACRFLDPLAQMVCPGDRPTPAYAAVGLLYLSILTDTQKRQAVETCLRQLAESDADLREVMADSREERPGSPQAILSAIEIDKQGAREDLEDLLFGSGNKPKPGKASVLHKVQNLAQEATQAYETNALHQARYALEEILLLDGDRPDVLRNLLTVTSEQENIEAYERYWQRHIKVLLWRIIRGDGADSAWDDLIRFYTQVAEATDRTLDKPMNDLPAVLPRPGLLPRWLEAHAALVWLEAATKSRRIWQSGLDGKQLALGQQGYLSLMRYWFHLFNPEFLPWLETCSNSHELAAIPLPSSESATRLIFNPTARMVRRFLEWFKVGFALSNHDNATQERHRQTVTALAGVISRLPLRLYTKDEEWLKASPPEAELDQKPFRSLLQEACSYPLFAFKLSRLLEASEWQAIVAEFGEPDIEDKLNPTIRMYLAFALCRVEREFDGLQLACRTIPDMPVEEMEEDKQNRHLWDNILRANIGQALNAESPPPDQYLAPQAVVPLSRTTRNMPEARKEGGTPENTPTAAWIAAIKRQIQELPGKEHLAAFRDAALDEIDTTYVQQIKVRAVLQKIQERVQKGEFDQARHEIDSLPDKPEEIKELKASLLGQLKEVEADFRLQKRIDSAIREAQRYAQGGDFKQARQAIQALPDAPQQLRDLKRNFLGQIDQAERESENAQQATSDLLRRLKARGIKQDVIARIASDNHINMNNPTEFYALLRAIDEQM